MLTLAILSSQENLRTDKMFIYVALTRLSFPLHETLPEPGAEAYRISIIYLLYFMQVILFTVQQIHVQYSLLHINARLPGFQSILLIEAT